MKRTALILLIGIAAATAGIIAVVSSRAPGTGGPANTQKILVAASFYPLYFFASQIAGDAADVLNVTPANAEPHDYDPPPQTIAQLEQARVLVLNGTVEPWGEKIKNAIDPGRTLLVLASDGIANQTIAENGRALLDPHVWLSPPLAKLMAAKIETGMASADPAHADYYARNARALEAQLDDLDAAYRQGLVRCADNHIVTSHAAFGYLATAYHLSQVPIAGLSPDTEPSPRQLAAIADFVKRNNIKVIFFESLVSPKLSQAIAREAGAQTMVLNPVEGLPDEDRAAGKNYFTIMRENLANLVTALRCKP